MTGDEELDAIRRRYEHRGAIPADRYSMFNPEVLGRIQERQRTIVKLLRQAGISSLDGLDILEVGCGSGMNLLELIQLGANPAHLVGNDLIEERLITARRLLPADVRLFGGDASTLPVADSTIDIVYQSTVFSSILDRELQDRLASAMWRWLRPGGGVLWYDFVVDNPSNPDVAGIPVRRIRDLFPDGSLVTRRVTLAPPIARRLVRVHPSLATTVNLLPALRTHVVAWIKKQ